MANGGADSGGSDGRDGDASASPSQADQANDALDAAAALDSEQSGFDPGALMSATPPATTTTASPTKSSAVATPGSFSSSRGDMNMPKAQMTREAISHAATRLPPHSIESEQAVLGALLISPDGLDQIADIVAENDFYQFARHRGTD